MAMMQTLVSWVQFGWWKTPQGASEGFGLRVYRWAMRVRGIGEFRTKVRSAHPATTSLISSSFWAF